MVFSTLIARPVLTFRRPRVLVLMPRASYTLQWPVRPRNTNAPPSNDKARAGQLRRRRPYAVRAPPIIEDSHRSESLTLMCPRFCGTSSRCGWYCASAFFLAGMSYSFERVSLVVLHTLYK